MAKRPSASMRGRNRRWCVLSIHGLIYMMSAGMRKNTVSIRNRIDLMSTRLMSSPILIFMNESASKPEIVVRLEAEISGMASVSARMVASRGSRCSRSSV